MSSGSQYRCELGEEEPLEVWASSFSDWVQAGKRHDSAEMLLVVVHLLNSGQTGQV